MSDGIVSITDNYEINVDGKRWEVEVSIDMRALVSEIATNAVRNQGGRAKLCGGLIVARRRRIVGDATK